MIGAMAHLPAMGATIRRARERMRWTQQQLADAIGVAVRTVNDWENDRSYPRNSIGALEDVLRVNLTAAPVRNRLSNAARELLRRDLGDVDGERVIRYAERLEADRPDPDRDEDRAG